MACTFCIESLVTGSDRDISPLLQLIKSSRVHLKNQINLFVIIMIWYTLFWIKHIIIIIISPFLPVLLPPCCAHCNPPACTCYRCVVSFHGSKPPGLYHVQHMSCPAADQ